MSTSAELFSVEARDGRYIAVVPLLYGRARITISADADARFNDGAW